MNEAERIDRENELLNELNSFNEERNRVRQIVGAIGGTSYRKVDLVMNIVFIVIIAAFFTIELTTSILPTRISVEIGILLVSIKIVWMIHSHNKFYHFQFWILNSIEFRINDLVSRMKNLEKATGSQEGKQSGSSTS